MHKPSALRLNMSLQITGCMRGGAVQMGSVARKGRGLWIAGGPQLHCNGSGAWTWKGASCRVRAARRIRHRIPWSFPPAPVTFPNPLWGRWECKCVSGYAQHYHLLQTPVNFRGKCSGYFHASAQGGAALPGFRRPGAVQKLLLFFTQLGLLRSRAHQGHDK